MNLRRAFQAFQRRSGPTPPPSGAAVAPWNLRAVLIGLMVPMGMTVLNLSMFGVALPFIRDSFQAEADTIAWLVTAYTLPFVMFMPLYGRLSDGLGKRRLFTIGIIIFFIGTVICLLAQTIPQLLVGRVIQGVGTAGVNPLCIAIISELFPDSQRGKALGTWSSTGPATSMVAPFVGGFLVDQWGWQTMFVPGVLAAAAAMYVVRGYVPKLAPKSQPGFLRHFDWLGLTLLSASIMALVAYLSSRLLTGVEPLRDWRLALATVIFLAAFVWWEKRYSQPLVPLAILRSGGFVRASIAGSIRMILMSSEAFLIPLYLSDLYHLSGAQVGLMLTMHSGALLTTVRLGGRLGDHWSRRWPIALGFCTQASMMLFFGLLPGEAPLWSVAAGLVAHGAGAGMSLAVLHRVALDDVPAQYAGAAAGLYSMARFFGSIIGTTLGGVILAWSLANNADVVAGYNLVFFFVASVGALGVLIVLQVKESMALRATAGD